MSTTTTTKTVGGGKRSKGSLTLTSASKSRELDDLLSGMTNQIDSIALAAASDKDAKQRAERELDLERSKLRAHELKDKNPKPMTAGGKSAREQQVMDELAQLGIGIDGAESNVKNFKKSREQLVKELEDMRIRAEGATAAGKKLEGELTALKAAATATDTHNKKLEGELASAKTEIDRLTAKAKKDYDEHVRTLDEQARKEERFEEELAAKEELLDRVIATLRIYRARVEAYGDN